jgi:hypothetical protein
MKGVPGKTESDESNINHGFRNRLKIVRM